MQVYYGSAMRMNLRQIEAFQAAMECGSATAASRLLHISQPAVSRLIGDLELAIGFQLFERRARGLVPTADARALYDEVRRCFVGLDQIGHLASAIREKASGRVRVVALSKYADGVIASFVGGFLKRNPGIAVVLESAGTAGVVQGIVTQSFDIGIAAATVSDPLIRTEPLFESGVVLAMSPADPLAAHNVVPLRALTRRPMVMLPDDSQYGAVIDRGLRSAGVRPQIVGRARSHGALYRMVEAGAGLALVDEAVAADHGSARVVFRAISPPISRTVATLVNRRVAPSTATKAFLDSLRAEIGTAAFDAP
jgi:DNA-binding transcriptional LysR family regulator